MIPCETSLQERDSVRVSSTFGSSSSKAAVPNCPFCLFHLRMEETLVTAFGLPASASL